MSKNKVFKSDEELNKALDDISENYSKPPTKITDTEYPC
jgi:hypothetical protein